LIEEAPGVTDVWNAQNGGFVGSGFSWTSNLLSLAGGTYITVPNNSILQPATLYLQATIRNPTSFGYILAKGTDGCNAPSYGIDLAGGFPRFILSTTEVSPFEALPNTAVDVFNGQFHTIIAKFESGTMTLTVDNITVTQSISGSIQYGLPTSNDLYIGAYPGSCLIPYSGEIKDVIVACTAPTQPGNTCPITCPNIII
jgi:Concanavalin A-like lectin/glucanases superfamily